MPRAHNFSSNANAALRVENRLPQCAPESDCQRTIQGLVFLLVFAISIYVAPAAEPAARLHNVGAMDDRAAIAFPLVRATDVL